MSMFIVSYGKLAPVWHAIWLVGPKELDINCEPSCNTPGRYVGHNSYTWQRSTNWVSPGKTVSVVVVVLWLFYACHARGWHLPTNVWHHFSLFSAGPVHKNTEHSLVMTWFGEQNKNISIISNTFSKINHKDNWQFLAIYCAPRRIKAETKWRLYARRHFQIHFLEWKSMNFD